MDERPERIVYVKQSSVGDVFKALFLFFIVMPIVVTLGCLVCVGVVGTASRKSPTPATFSVGDKPYQRVGGQGNVHFVVVPTGGNLEVACRSAISDLRRPGEDCIILFWHDRTMVPAGLPVTEEAAEARVAMYTFVRGTGLDALSIKDKNGERVVDISQIVDTQETVETSQELERRRASNDAYVPLETNEQRAQREREAEQAEQALLAAEAEAAERQRLESERMAKQARAEARAEEVRRTGRPLIVDKIELD